MSTTNNQQIDSCKLCKNRAFNMQRGMLCSITNDKPNFEVSCNEFLHDDVEAQKEANRVDRANYSSTAWDEGPETRRQAPPILHMISILFAVAMLIIQLVLYLGK